MRYLALVAFLALPAVASAPRKIPFKCDDDYCIVSRADWQWMMEAMMAKDALISRCYKDS